MAVKIDSPKATTIPTEPAKGPAGPSKVPSPTTPRVRSGGSRTHARRTGSAKAHTAEAHEAPEEEFQDQRLQTPTVQRLAKRVHGLNRRRPQDWTHSDLHELDSLMAELMEITEREAGRRWPGDPYARRQALFALKQSLRSLLQTLQPPEELLDLFLKLWAKCREDPDASTYSRKSIMTAKVRTDVMNRQVEEAVDEADRLATEWRVEAIREDEERRRHGGGSDEEAEESPAPGDAAAAAEAVEPPPGPEKTLSFTLKQLKRKRRTIGVSEANDAAAKALDTMRALREAIAPRWAPDTQPWLLHTADTHVYQITLAVIPEELFRETEAYQGIQNLRAGEHAFSLRAADKLMESAGRRKD